MKGVLFRIGLVLLVLGGVGLWIAYAKLPEYSGLAGAFSVVLDGKAAARYNMLLELKKYGMIAACVGLLLSLISFDFDWLKRKKKETPEYEATVALPLYCDKCHEANSHDAKFCKSCGTKLE